MCKIIASNIVVGLVSAALSIITFVEMFQTNDVEFRGDLVDIAILAILGWYNFYEVYIFCKMEKEQTLKKLDKIRSIMLVVFTLALTSVFLKRYLEYKESEKDFEDANHQLIEVCPYYSTGDDDHNFN
mgnify:FL=1